MAALVAVAAAPARAVVLPLPPVPHYAAKVQVVEVSPDGKRTDRVERRLSARMGRPLRTSFSSSLGRLITLEIAETTEPDERMYVAKFQLFDGGQANAIAAPVVNMMGGGGATLVTGLPNGERVEITLQLRDHLPGCPK
jgi:hypothetical protein